MRWRNDIVDRNRYYSDGKMVDVEMTPNCTEFARKNVFRKPPWPVYHLHK
jgi:hypothetical protein